MENAHEIAKHVAKLANLEFTEEEMKDLIPQFSRIVDYIGIIDEIDLTGIEPLASVAQSSNFLREDEEMPPLSVSEALRNAPKHNETFFKVPKVIE